MHEGFVKDLVQIEMGNETRSIRKRANLRGRLFSSRLAPR